MIEQLFAAAAEPVDAAVELADAVAAETAAAAAAAVAIASAVDDETVAVAEGAIVNAIARSGLLSFRYWSQLMCLPSTMLYLAMAGERLLVLDLRLMMLAVERVATQLHRNLTIFCHGHSVQNGKGKWIKLNSSFVLGSIFCSTQYLELQVVLQMNQRKWI